MFPFNRVGGIRGENGATLDDLLAALQAQATSAELLNAINDLSVNIQTLISYTGAPLDTACNLSQTQLLCSILTALTGEGGSGAPVEPAWRCGGAFNGGWLVSEGWSSSVGGHENAANVFYANFEASYSNPAAYVESTAIPAETGSFPTLFPGIVPRTVCISAYVGTGVLSFWVTRYVADTLVYFDTNLLGSVAASDVWTEGVQYDVDPDYCYRFFVVMPEGTTEVSAGTYLFYTEGALG